MPTGIPYGQKTTVAINPRRSFTAQYLASDGVYQYLSFLDNFRTVLLSCSTTLAAYSLEIAKENKHDRKVQDKEFIEYFDVV